MLDQLRHAILGKNDGENESRVQKLPGAVKKHCMYVQVKMLLYWYILRHYQQACRIRCPLLHGGVFLASVYWMRTELAVALRRNGTRTNRGYKINFHFTNKPHAAFPFSCKQGKGHPTVDPYDEWHQWGIENGPFAVHKTYLCIKGMRWQQLTENHREKTTTFDAIGLLPLREPSLIQYSWVMTLYFEIITWPFDYHST